MNSYHGGKIESYVLGYIDKAKIIDISSAYPYAKSLLPKITGKVFISDKVEDISKYFYVFIKCDIDIKNKDLIHPIIVKNPINSTNISPYGYLENITITKVEYDYLIKK